MSRLSSIRDQENKMLGVRTWRGLKLVLGTQATCTLHTGELAQVLVQISPDWSGRKEIPYEGEEEMIVKIPELTCDFKNHTRVSVYQSHLGSRLIYWVSLTPIVGGCNVWHNCVVTLTKPDVFLSITCHFRMCKVKVSEQTVFLCSCTHHIKMNTWKICAGTLTSWSFDIIHEYLISGIIINDKHI
jgi:hypothetical protein